MTEDIINKMGHEKEPDEATENHQDEDKEQILEKKAPKKKKTSGSEVKKLREEVELLNEKYLRLFVPAWMQLGKRAFSGLSLRVIRVFRGSSFSVILCETLLSQRPLR